MIQFLIVATIVFFITGYVWDVETAIKTGPKLIDYWMFAGLVIMIISPFINLAWIVYYLSARVVGLFRRKSSRRNWQPPF